MTLIQGAGVDWPGPRIVTYSRPLAAKPPSPLKNSKSGGGGAMRRFRARHRALSRDPLSFLRFRHTVELIGERAALPDQNDPRHRQEQRTGLRRKQIGPQHEDAAAAGAPRRPDRTTGSRAPASPARSADPARRMTRARSGSPDRPQAASSASIRVLAAIAARDRDISISAMRSSAIGRSPEMLMGHSPGCAPAPRRMVSEDGRSVGPACSRWPASRWNSPASPGSMPR